MSSTTPADRGPESEPSGYPREISTAWFVLGIPAGFVVTLMRLANLGDAALSPLVCMLALVLGAPWIQRAGTITQVCYAALACFVLFGCVIPPAGFVHVVNSYLLLGWIGFLLRNVPQVAWYVPSLAAGAVLVIIVLGGIHALGCSLFASRGRGAAKWRWRWSLAIV